MYIKKKIQYLRKIIVFFVIKGTFFVAVSQEYLAFFLFKNYVKPIIYSKLLRKIAKKQCLKIADFKI